MTVFFLSLSHFCAASNLVGLLLAILFQLFYPGLYFLAVASTRVLVTNQTSAPTLAMGAGAADLQNLPDQLILLLLFSVS
jgi:hypothetical protein